MEAPCICNHSQGTACTALEYVWACPAFPGLAAAGGTSRYSATQRPEGFGPGSSGRPILIARRRSNRTYPAFVSCMFRGTHGPGGPSARHRCAHSQLQPYGARVERHISSYREGQHTCEHVPRRIRDRINRSRACAEVQRAMQAGGCGPSYVVVFCNTGHISDYLKNPSSLTLQISSSSRDSRHWLSLFADGVRLLPPLHRLRRSDGRALGVLQFCSAHSLVPMLCPQAHAVPINLQCGLVSAREQRALLVGFVVACRAQRRCMISHPMWSSMARWMRGVPRMLRAHERRRSGLI